MTSHPIDFRSNTKNIGLTAPDVPCESKIDAWAVCETITPHPEDNLREKGIGSYQLSLQREVTTQKDVWNALDEAQQLARELDVAWCYAWGKPYFRTRLTWQSSEAPDGWTGNLRAVEGEIQRESAGVFLAAVQVVARHWEWWPCLPLQRALKIREASIIAEPIIHELIELHMSSHQAHESQLFSLAKALEVVGAFFGKSRAARNSGLQDAMTKIGIDTKMTQDVAWLFNIANERFDVRHAWNRGVTVHNRRPITCLAAGWGWGGFVGGGLRLW